MNQRLTKPVTIALVVLMIVALGGWILQWQLADDQTAQAESCGLAAAALERGSDDGAPLTGQQRAAFEAGLAACDRDLP